MSGHKPLCYTHVAMLLSLLKPPMSEPLLTNWSEPVNAYKWQGVLLGGRKGHFKGHSGDEMLGCYRSTSISKESAVAKL